MTVTEVVRELEGKGSAQTRKTYGRHGVQPPLFGVSYAELGKLKRKIKTDHELALSLWDTGNHDARVLATMVADMHKVTNKLADSWINDGDVARIFWEGRHGVLQDPGCL